MPNYRVGVPVGASDPEEAAEIITAELGADRYAMNDIGGLTVELIPDEKPYLVCRGCGEAFDSLIFAQEHGTYIPGPDPQWCGEAGFDIVPEEDAL